MVTLSLLLAVNAPVPALPTYMKPAESASFDPEPVTVIAPVDPLTLPKIVALLLVAAAPLLIVSVPGPELPTVSPPLVVKLVPLPITDMPPVTPLALPKVVLVLVSLLPFRSTNIPFALFPTINWPVPSVTGEDTPSVAAPPLPMMVCVVEVGTPLVQLPAVVQSPLDTFQLVAAWAVHGFASANAHNAPAVAARNGARAGQPRTADTVVMFALTIADALAPLHRARSDAAVQLPRALFQTMR